MKGFVKVSKQSLSALCVLALLTTVLIPAFAQQPSASAKRSLTHQDYDSWHSIQSPQISRDGKFIAYAFMAQDADSEIVVRNLTSGAEWRAPRGYRAPAPPPDDSLPNVPEIIAANARLVRPVFTADSRFVIFSIEPTKAEVHKAKKAGSSPNAAQRGSSPTVREGSQSSPRPPKKKEYGSDLVLRNTASGTERNFSDALDYTLSKDAKTLVFAVSSKKEEANGLFAVTTENDAAPAALLAGKGKYLKPTWDEDQTELSFISDRDDAEAKQPKFKVYLWSRNGNASAIESADRNHASAPIVNAAEVVSTSSPGFRKD